MTRDPIHPPAEDPAPRSPGAGIAACVVAVVVWASLVAAMTPAYALHCAEEMGPWFSVLSSAGLVALGGVTGWLVVRVQTPGSSLLAPAVLGSLPMALGAVGHELQEHTVRTVIASADTSMMSIIAAVGHSETLRIVEYGAHWTAIILAGLAVGLAVAAPGRGARAIHAGLFVVPLPAAAVAVTLLERRSPATASLVLCAVLALVGLWGIVRKPGDTDDDPERWSSMYAVAVAGAVAATLVACSHAFVAGALRQLGSLSSEDGRRFLVDMASRVGEVMPARNLALAFAAAGFGLAFWSGRNDSGRVRTLLAGTLVGLAIGVAIVTPLRTESNLAELLRRPWSARSFEPLPFAGHDYEPPGPIAVVVTADGLRTAGGEAMPTEPESLIAALGQLRRTIEHAEDELPAPEEVEDELDGALEEVEELARMAPLPSEPPRPPTLVAAVDRRASMSTIRSLFGAVRTAGFGGLAMVGRLATDAESTTTRATWPFGGALLDADTFSIEFRVQLPDEVEESDYFLISLGADIPAIAEVGAFGEVSSRISLQDQGAWHETWSILGGPRAVYFNVGPDATLDVLLRTHATVAERHHAWELTVYLSEDASGPRVPPPPPPPPPPGRFVGLSLGPLLSTGGLNRRRVSRALRAAHPEFERCFREAQERRPAHLARQVRVAALVASGGVQRIITPAFRQDEAFTTCMVDALARLPRPRGNSLTFVQQMVLLESEPAGEPAPELSDGSAPR